LGSILGVQGVQGEESGARIQETGDEAYFRIVSRRSLRTSTCSKSACPAAADQRHLTVVDYFLMLPADTFEAPPSSWLELAKNPGCGAIDTANGYLMYR
jgi:hypothetical protein